MTTTQISTTDRFIAYDADHRAKATLAGRPIQRMAEFLVPAMEDSIVLRTIDGVAICSHESRPANALSLEEVLEGELQMLVADKDAIPTLLAQLKAGDDDDKDAAYQIGLLKSLGVSHFMPYLPGLLAQRYWLPEGMDEESLTDWAAAFSLRAPGADVMGKRLASLALEPFQAPDPLQEDGTPLPRGQRSKKSNAIYMANREREVLKASTYLATASTCRAYKSMQTHGEILKGTIAGDVMLRQRNIINGSVSRVKVTTAVDKIISGIASTPFRFKEGRKVRLFGESDVAASVNLEKLDFDGDEMEITIETSSKNAQRWANEALASDGYLWLAETVMYGGGGMEEGRWLNKSTEHQPAKNEVPLDIRLAAGM